MVEPIIAPIAFAVMMLVIAVFAISRAIRRRSSGRDAASEEPRTRSRRAS